MRRGRQLLSSSASQRRLLPTSESQLRKIVRTSVVSVHILYKYALCTEHPVSRVFEIFYLAGFQATTGVRTGRVAARRPRPRALPPLALPSPSDTTDLARSHQGVLCFTLHAIMIVRRPLAVPPHALISTSQQTDCTAITQASCWPSSTLLLWPLQSLHCRG